jgi:thiol-disulfide isomerase/thioredoxin
MRTPLGISAICLLVSAAATAGCREAPPPAVTLQVVDHAGLLAKVESFRGKVVVLDCWSTSCPPCVKEFPRLLELAARYPDDLACLSLSLDYEGIGDVDEVIPRVRGFLEKVDARITNLLSGEEADAMLDKLELVSVPGVFVYGRDGKLLERYDDDMAATRLGRGFTYEDVEQTVRDAIGP